MIVKTGQYVQIESGEYKIEASSDKPGIIKLQLRDKDSCELPMSDVEEIIETYNKILKVDISCKKLDDIKISSTAYKNIWDIIICRDMKTTLSQKNSSIDLPTDDYSKNDLINALRKAKDIMKSWTIPGF